MGNSPLHYAILVGIGPEIIQLLVYYLFLLLNILILIVYFP